MQKKVDEKWMRQALELAKKAAEAGEVPVGAVIVKDDELLAEGYNQPISAKDPTAHAEIQALREAAKNLGNYRLPETTLYVTVEPCSMCAGALVHSRVKRVVYGADEPRAGAVVSQSQLFDASYLNHRVEYEGGCLAEESAQLMKNFFKSRRK